MRRVGFAVTVADAMEEVKAAAHQVTRRAGGRGAVREVCDLLLKESGRWSAVTVVISKTSLLYKSHANFHIALYSEASPECYTRARR